MMERNVLLFHGFLALCSVHGRSLQPSFSDEFDGESLDESKWEITITDSPYNDELQSYRNSTENLYLQHGNLVIKPIRQSYHGRDYTSGRIFSKFAWKYGRVDVRAKLPEGFGLWPAIWLLPRDEVHGYWPDSGEIDIVEARGQELMAIQNAIHHGDSHAYESSDRIGIPCRIDEFHIYTMDWTPTELVFRLDDVAYWSVDLDRNFDDDFYTENGAPFNQYFYLVLNVAVGGNFLADPTPSTVWTYPEAEMHVDYVRVYPLENIAQLKCVFKTDTLTSELCDAVQWACVTQNDVDLSTVCTDELMECCSFSCADDLLLELANRVYTFFDSITGECISPATRKYVAHDGSVPKIDCLVNEEASVYDICGSVTWACGGGNTYADVSTECSTGNDVINCCNANPATCDEDRLRQFAGLVFQAYYDIIPTNTCNFGGAAKLSRARVICTDGYERPSPTKKENCTLDQLFP